MSNREPTEFVGAYTVILFLIAGLMIFSILTHEMVIATARSLDAVAVFRMIQSIQAVYAIFAFSVGVLRALRSPLALPTTAAISILLAPLIPFGTAAFVYWMVSVRQRERAGHTV